MAIKDRGIIKWQPALIMPELAALWKEADKEYYQQSKLVKDDSQIEQIENTIHYTMEFHLQVTLTLYNEGYPQTLTGYIVYIDPLTKDIRVEKNDRTFEKINFTDILEVDVQD